jgi:hypothetical protein
MFGWVSCAAMRASSRNISTNSGSRQNESRIRLITTTFSKPFNPAWRVSQISAMPPVARRVSRV